MRLLPNASAESEFVAGFTGDCGEDAELSLLHVTTDETLNAANLNAIVHKEISDKEASSSGAEPLSAIAQDLRERKIVFDYWPYAEPFTVDWPYLLKNYAGIYPIILELANAQALPGDERGVHYHFVCVLGVNDEGAYLVADGDNPLAKQGKLAVYTEEQIANAKPCGAIRGHIPPKPKPIVPPTQIYGYFDEIDNAWVVRSGHGEASGKRIVGAMLTYYRNWPAQGSKHGFTAFGLPLADETEIPNHPGCWWQPFERGVLIYDPHRVVDNPPGSTGPIYVAHSTYHP